MEKLKKVIEQYGRWSEIGILILRIEAHIESDFSHSLENAKSLLETIGKEICTLKGHTLNANSTINGVLKNAFSVLGYSNASLVNQISSALATIGQQVGELRNEIGITSHGRSLAEIRERNSRVNILTKDFLIDTIEIVSCFLIRSFENDNPRQANVVAENGVEYLEAEGFNEFWDDAFGEFQMGAYSYAASEILFNVDKQAYINEYNAFTEDETTEE